MSTEEVHDTETAASRLSSDHHPTQFLSHEEATAQYQLDTKLGKAGF